MPDLRAVQGRDQQLPAVPVSTHQTGAESWSYSFSAQQPGALVWTQAYDPLWRLTGARGSTQLPELSVINGYLVGPGNHSGTIAFAGESSAIAGVLISLLTGLALLLAVVLRRNWAAKLFRSWRPRHNANPGAHSAGHDPQYPLRQPGPTGWSGNTPDLPSCGGSASATASRAECTPSLARRLCICVRIACG